MALPLGSPREASAALCAVAAFGWTLYLSALGPGAKGGPDSSPPPPPHPPHHHHHEQQQQHESVWTTILLHAPPCLSDQRLLLILLLPLLLLLTAIKARSRLLPLLRERAAPPPLNQRNSPADEAEPPGLGIATCGLSGPRGPVPSPLLVLLHRRRLRVSAHAVAHAKAHVERAARALLNAAHCSADPRGPALRGDFVPTGSGYEGHAVERPDTYDLLIPLRIPAAAGCVPGLCAGRRCCGGSRGPSPHGHCPLRAPLACRGLAQGFCCPAGGPALCPERVHAWFRGTMVRAAGAARSRLGTEAALTVSARDSSGRVVVRVLPRDDFVCCRLPLRVRLLPALPLAAAVGDDGGVDVGGAVFLTPQWVPGETPGISPSLIPAMLSTSTRTQVPQVTENQTPTETSTMLAKSRTLTPTLTHTPTPTSTATPAEIPTPAPASDPTQTQTPIPALTSPPAPPRPAPSWRVVFPVHEQRLLARLATLGGPRLGPQSPSDPGTRGPPCHIMCLQLLKSFRDTTGVELRRRDPAAAALWSRLLCTFHLKAALFHLLLGSSTSSGPPGMGDAAAVEEEELPRGPRDLDRPPTRSRPRGPQGHESRFPEAWGEERLSERLGDLVAFLRGCLDRGQLPHPFVGSGALLPPTGLRGPRQPNGRRAAWGAPLQRDANLLQGEECWELRWASARLELFWETVGTMADREALEEEAERTERRRTGRSRARGGSGPDEGPSESSRNGPLTDRTPNTGTPSGGPPKKVTPAKETPTKRPPTKANPTEVTPTKGPPPTKGDPHHRRIQPVLSNQQDRQES